tara:strand:+ start:1655 stop:2524 length:870 start_codon:yes stop_codon:yes gene_type:complete
MPHNSHDQSYSEYGNYEDINNHYNTEVSLVRMGNDFKLVKNSNGDLLFQMESQKWDDSRAGKEAENITVSDTVITYKKNGDMYIDMPSEARRGRTRYGRATERMLSYLPESVGIYETNSNNKMYLMYSPGDDVRRYVYSPKTVWDITKTNYIKLRVDGKVEGGKRIDRGEKKFAENKPLKDQLEEKHYREMTKARLKSDLELDYVTQYATFRGQETGTKHYAIEMYRPSCYGQNGPNDGLIRRLFVGRFMEDDADAERCKQLAVEIAKDLPDSCLATQFTRMRDELTAS